jgi:hypothetical protein
MKRVTHQLHEMRSLMMHRIVAERFHQDPVTIIEFGLSNLERWRKKGVDCDDFEIWEEILRFTPQRLTEVFSSSSEESIRLRQSSPFAGLISEDSRQEILASTQ